VNQFKVAFIVLNHFYGFKEVQTLIREITLILVYTVYKNHQNTINRFNVL